MSLRAAITVALEALEVGDQEQAVYVLLNALEDGPRIERVRCEFCDQGFEWPGLLGAHLDHGCSVREAA
jgi:hypothetical protein